jgi:hypothetical protein
MNISVRYAPDLKEAVRLSLFLRRKLLCVYVAWGGLAVIFGALALGFGEDPGTALVIIAVGIAIIIMIPLMTWVSVSRNRAILLGEVELTLTSEGLRGRAGIATFDLPWHLVAQVHDVKGFWIFVANKFNRITVAKRVFSPEQQAEVTAFIAARTMQASGQAQ